MLESLRAKVSDRKLRLFACGCCRRLFHPFQSHTDLEAVDTAEQHADGLLSANKLASRWPERIPREGVQICPRTYPGRLECELRAIQGVMQSSAWEGARKALRAVAETGAKL